MKFNIFVTMSDENLKKFFKTPGLPSKKMVERCCQEMVDRLLSNYDEATKEKPNEDIQRI